MLSKYSYFTGKERDRYLMSRHPDKVPVSKELGYLIAYC